MTLRLLGTLRWEPEGLAARPLPVVLPAALLLVLARHAQWISRAELASLFWGGLPDEAALLNLRVNLHKARLLLVELGIDAPLEAERRRVRWLVPTALTDGGAAPGTLAAGFDLPEFEAFQAWLHDGRKAQHAPLLSAAPAADDAPAGADIGPGFYGRRAEVARLRSCTAPVALVLGEAGVGKSRLVAEALGAAAWLRCRGGLRAMSFAAVAELFEGHPHWTSELGAYRLDVARLLPDIAPEEPLPPLDAITARVRLFEGLARVVEQHAPVLAVDDLQWADATTLEWLALLAHRGRMRWIATLRNGEELAEPVAAAVRSLQAAGLAEVVELQGLDRPALNALLHERRPDLAEQQSFPRPHPWLAALAGYTGGNAFCAIEVMDALRRGDQPRHLARMPLPQRVAAMLRQRFERLSPDARKVLDAAAIALDRPSLAQLSAVTGLARPEVVAALESAQRHGLMHDTGCRHDLVRDAVRQALPATRAAELHRLSALHLAGERAAPDAIAHHWRAAGDDEAAWPYVMCAAQRMRQCGERHAAVAALAELRDASADETLTLRAEVMLAQEHLFDDLPAGRRALESTLVRASCLPASPGRRTIEAHALSGLIDNAVFSGDLARAAELAPRLLDRLPGQANDTLIEAHQVLIELAMREGNVGAAIASLEGLRQARAPRPVVLSFEAQFHWFNGAVREARQVFEHLLARHADYCQGLTIENDLAVMCHALGELDRAEEMARRSLRSWVGVAHTQALSSLVLGATLVSAGRLVEARSVLDDALALGRQQGSDLFVGEALVRLARLHWCASDLAAARRHLDQARAHAGSPAEPLRASALALMEVLCAVDGDADGALAIELLGRLCARSGHPLVHARRWRAEAAHALAAGDRAAALAAAQQLSAVAALGSLAEWHCEALWLIADLDPGAAGARAEAQALAVRHGLGNLMRDDRDASLRRRAG